MRIFDAKNKPSRKGDSVSEFVKTDNGYEKIRYSLQGKEIGREPDVVGKVYDTDEEIIKRAIEDQRPFDIKPLIDKYKDREDALRIIEYKTFKFRF